MRCMFKDMETATIGRRGSLGARFDPADVSARRIDSSGQTAGRSIAKHPALDEARRTRHACRRLLEVERRARPCMLMPKCKPIHPFRVNAIRRALTFSRHEMPELGCNRPSIQQREGAGNAGRWPRPWPACRKKSRRQSPQVQPNIRHSLRDGLTAYT
jgi:hypothetical protein